jgi:hypothetical protein
MVEIRLVGFRMEDMEELQQIVADGLDAQGLGATGFVVFLNCLTWRCLDREPYPHVVVCSDEQDQLDIAARHMNISLSSNFFKKQLRLSSVDPSVRT